MTDPLTLQVEQWLDARVPAILPADTLNLVRALQADRERLQQEKEIVRAARVFYEAIRVRHHGRMPLEVAESYAALGALLAASPTKDESREEGK